MELRLIERADLEVSKWDTLIENAYNGSIYGYSWYLDTVAPDWKALIYGDYEIVLPVPTNRKKLIEQIYHPWYNQTFDFYALKVHDKGGLFMDYLEENFKVINIKIKTHIPRENWTIEKKVNLTLDLNKTADKITAQYSKSLRRNLKKCSDEHLHENVYVTPDSIVQMYGKEVGEKIENYDDSKGELMNDIIIQCLRNGKAFLMGVDHGKDNVVASGFYINSHNRIINLYAASQQEGDDVNAMSYMLNKIIKDNAESELLLDFEGSNIKGIYDYFASFGAQEEYYYVYSINNMPSLIKGLF